MTSQSCDPILVKIGQRSRLHGHILYTAEITITPYWVAYQLRGWGLTCGRSPN